MEKCQSLLKIYFQILFMDPCSQLILFFRYIFFGMVDLKYYNTIQTFFQ